MTRDACMDPKYVGCFYIASSPPRTPTTSSLRSTSPAPLSSSDLHDDRYVIVHVLVDIAQEARRDHAHPAKRDADQIHPPVALRIRNLPRRHDDLPRRVVARDTGYQPEVFEQGGAGEGDGGFDGFGAGDAEFELHRAANVVDGVGDEFGDEHVVVGCVADGATDDADGEGDGCHGCDEILRGC